MKTGIEGIKELYAKGDFLGAVDKCKKILEEDPDNFEILIMMTSILSIPVPEVNNENLAINLLETAIKKHPENADLHRALGDVHNHGTGDYEVAVEEYKKAIELNQNDWYSYYLLAGLYKYPGVELSAEEAIRLLKKAISINPNDWQTRRELGTLLWKIGSLEDAKREYKAALECEPPPDYYSREQLKGFLQKLEKGVSYESGYLIKIERTNVLSKLAYILTLLFWVIFLSGWVYASFFIPNKAEPIEIMSPRTIGQLYFISLAWIITPFIELIAIGAFLKGERSKKLVIVLIMNAIPISLLILLMFTQKGNIISAYKEILDLALAPFR